MQCLKVTPYLLHKEINEDVLIESVQSIPFSFISDHDWHELENSCSKEELEIFTSHYDSTSGFHILKGIPAIITDFDSKQYDQFEIDFSSFYIQKEDGSWYINNPLIPVSVITMLKSGGKYSNASEKLLPEPVIDQIQTLLSQRLKTPRAPAFSYVARNDTSNYYFYRKAHEHMPGTMLIEMARQALYHYAYSETGHQRGDVAISMTDLDIEFESYVESAYGIEILAYQSDIIMRSQPRTVDKTAAFYQNGRKVAQVKIKGSVMKNRLFKRLRTLHLPESHWFILSPRATHYVLLCTDRGEQKQVILHQISMSGIQLITKDFPSGNSSSIILYQQGMGFVTLPLSGEKICGDGYIELPFSELTASQTYQLQEIIKYNGIFHEKRSHGTVALNSQASNDAG